jgi:hypothetical protein
MASSSLAAVEQLLNAQEDAVALVTAAKKLAALAASCGPQDVPHITRLRACCLLYLARAQNGERARLLAEQSGNLLEALSKAPTAARARPFGGWRLLRQLSSTLEIQAAAVGGSEAQLYQRSVSHAQVRASG